MSIIKLTAASAFERGHDGVKIFHGACAARMVDRHVVLTIGNVPMPGVTAPSPGVVLMYGFRDTLDELQRMSAETGSLGAKVVMHIAEVNVEIGEIFTGQVTQNDICDLRFANVMRMRASLQEHIFEQFKVWSSEQESPSAHKVNRLKEIALRPDLFGRLLDSDPLFSRIEVLVIPVFDFQTKRIRQVGYMRPNAKIASIVQNKSNPFELVLPETWRIGEAA